MRVLITGANGFVAYYIIEELLRQKVEVIATGRGTFRAPLSSPLLRYAEMDFTEQSEIQKVFAAFKPTHIIHAGAISKPDVCEADNALANKMNVQSTVLLVQESKVVGANFFLVSTDFVFDGEKGNYAEDDERNAVNYYGKTKIAAENIVLDSGVPYTIIRPALIYGVPFTGRDNLITLLKQKLRNNESYKVFSDQTRTPTYVGDVAWATAALITKGHRGIFHVAGADVISPYQMAIETAKMLGADESLIEEVGAETLQQPAARPANTTLNIEKLKSVTGYQPISFLEGMRLTIL